MGTPIAFNSGTTASYDVGVFKKGTVALNLANTLASGYNWWNGVDVTSSQYLIYSDTFSQGQSTFANSRPTAWTTPDLTDASLIALINTLPDRVGLPLFTDVTSAVNWMNQTGKYYLVKTGYDDIVTTNLTLSLDSGWYNSYPGTGTNWNDLSGNFYNATLVNSPSFANGVFTFDGSDDYGSLNLNSGLLDLGTTFTIEAFMKLSNTSQTIAPIYSSMDVNVGQKTRGVGFYWAKDAEYGLGAGVIRLQFGIDAWAWQIFGSNGIKIDDTNWHHVVVSCSSMNTSSPTINFYIDGVKQTGTRWSAGSNGPILYSTNLNSLRIGSIYTATAPSYQIVYGAISVPILRIYSTSLSDSQVLSNFNAQRYRFGIGNNFITAGAISILDAKNPLSYPGTGTNWEDLTGSNNDGTLVNGVTYSTDLGGCLRTDSTNEGIPFPGVNNSNQWTICMTFRRDGNPGGYGRIAGSYSSIDRGEIALLNTTETIAINPPLTIGWLNTGTGIALNEVVHLTCYFSRNRQETDNVIVWKNGQKIYTNSVTDVDKGPTTGYVLGSRSDYNAENLPSSFVNVQTYNRKLSDVEVLQNYLQGAIVIDNIQVFIDASNPVSYPSTGTSWIDLTPNDNDATLFNSPVYSTEGGGSLDFDGTDDYATIPSDAAWAIGQNGSIEMWVKQESTRTANHRLWCVDNNSTNLDAYLSAGNTIFLHGGVVGTINGLTLNQWTQIMVIYTSGVISIYFNGVKQTLTGTSTGYNISGTGTLFIGQFAGGGSYYWPGKIGSFKLYSTALNELEVSQNFQAQKSRFGL